MTSLNKKFDVIIELSAKLSFRQAKKLMKPESTYFTVTPSLWNFVHSFSNNILSGKKYEILLMKSDTENLNRLAESDLIPVIRKTCKNFCFLDKNSKIGILKFVES